MKKPDYERVASVIAQILARIALTQPNPEEERTDADDRIRPSLD